MSILNEKQQFARFQNFQLCSSKETFLSKVSLFVFIYNINKKYKEIYVERIIRKNAKGRERGREPRGIFSLALVLLFQAGRRVLITDIDRMCARGGSRVSPTRSRRRTSRNCCAYATGNENEYYAHRRRQVVRATMTRAAQRRAATAAFPPFSSTFLIICYSRPDQTRSGLDERHFVRR